MYIRRAISVSYACLSNDEEGDGVGSKGCGSGLGLNGKGVGGVKGKRESEGTGIRGIRKSYQGKPMGQDLICSRFSHEYTSVARMSWGLSDIFHVVR